MPPADNIPDFDKMTPEEVMAWMESLAKRQGAIEGFTTAADVVIAEIDPSSVEIDEPGYVPFGEVAPKKTAPPSKPTAEKPQPAAPPPPAPVISAPPLPAEPISQPAASAPEPMLLPLEPDPGNQETEPVPSVELGGMAWLESLAADQSFDFPQIDFSSLSAEIEPAPLPVTTPSNPMDWLESLTQEEAMAEPAVEEEPEVDSLDAMADITDPLAGVDPMLWLESLAKRQGARSEELMTDANIEVPMPKDGVDSGPGYTGYSVEKDQTKSAPKAQPEPVAATDPNAWLASMVAENVFDEPASQLISGMSDEDIRDALSRGSEIPREEMEAFLDRQLTRQLEGADLPMPEEYDPNAPAVPAELPDWLLEQVQPPTSDQHPTTELPALLDQIVEPPAVEDLPDWLKEDISSPDAMDLESIFETDSEIAVARMPIIDVNDPWVEAFNEELEMAGSDEVPDWYERNLNDPQRIAAVEGLVTGSDANSILEDEPLAAETELEMGMPQPMPDWLNDATSDDVTIPEWITADVSPVTDEAIVEDMPNWLKEAEITIDPNDIPDWLRETAEEPLLSMSLESSEPILPALITPPAEPVVHPAMVSPAPVPASAIVDVNTALKSAREKYSGGDLDGSLQSYESIIRANVALDMVVGDMVKMVEHHKDNPAVYRVLGDSLMRQGKLQAALDTYRKALNQL